MVLVLVLLILVVLLVLVALLSEEIYISWTLGSCIQFWEAKLQISGVSIINTASFFSNFKLVSTSVK